jgi:DNA-binding response OmpR family regulator
MAKILIFEPEARYRMMLRYVLEGINHRVTDTGAIEAIPELLASSRPDMVVLGVHLDDESDAMPRPEWQVLPNDAPTLILFSGDPDLRPAFMGNWSGSCHFNIMVQPVEPYPLLAMVKAMMTKPVEWRGGQHALE